MTRNLLAIGMMVTALVAARAYALDTSCLGVTETALEDVQAPVIPGHPATEVNGWFLAEVKFGDAGTTVMLVRLVGVDRDDGTTETPSLPTSYKSLLVFANSNSDDNYTTQSVATAWNHEIQTALWENAVRYAIRLSEQFRLWTKTWWPE